MARDGTVIAMIAVSASSGTIVGGPDIFSRGFVSGNGTSAHLQRGREEVQQRLDAIPRPYHPDDARIKEEVVRTLAPLFHPQSRQAPVHHGARDGGSVAIARQVKSAPVELAPIAASELEPTPATTASRANSARSRCSQWRRSRPSVSSRCTSGINRRIWADRLAARSQAALAWLFGYDAYPVIALLLMLGVRIWSGVNWEDLAREIGAGAMVVRRDWPPRWGYGSPAVSRSPGVIGAQIAEVLGASLNSRRRIPGGRLHADLRDRADAETRADRSRVGGGAKAEAADSVPSEPAIERLADELTVERPEGILVARWRMARHRGPRSDPAQGAAHRAA